MNFHDKITATIDISDNYPQNASMEQIDISKMSKLIVVGPVEIPFGRSKKGLGKLIEDSHAKQFWESDLARKVKTKQGCYVFATKAGKGYTPWYIGKATKSMLQECFAPHKLNHYNKTLFQNKKCTPVMFFVVAQENKNKLPQRIVKDMEKYMIQSALYKNPKITNVGNTNNVPKWSIKGVIRSGKGKPSKESTIFTKMMGI